VTKIIPQYLKVTIFEAKEEQALNRVLGPGREMLFEVMAHGRAIVRFYFHPEGTV
jgi:hypothetical protein